MKVKIGNLEFEEKVTIKQFLLKSKNGEIDPLTGIELLADNKFYQQYMMDAIDVCKSCGITPSIDNTPGEEEYSMLMFDLFCGDKPINKRIFRKLAEDIDYGAKDYFYSWNDEEQPIIGKPDGLYGFLRIPYKNIESLWADIEHVAIQIIAQSEPNLGLKTLAAAIMEINGGTTEDPVQSEKQIEENNNYKKMADQMVAAYYPYIIHVAKDIDDAFPTHTHGLNKIGWPEFMINARCYGSEGNGLMINDIYRYFNNTERKKVLEKILQGETIEVPINKLCSARDWRGLDYPVCFRRVPITFEGVKSAYDHVDGIDPDLVVVQIYVKGDDFALTDEYYKGEIF